MVARITAVTALHNNVAKTFVEIHKGADLVTRRIFITGNSADNVAKTVSEFRRETIAQLAITA
jgi:hypothetical protein